jgi:hypothetical protein
VGIVFIKLLPADCNSLTSSIRKPDAAMSLQYVCVLLQQHESLIRDAGGRELANERMND